MKYLVTLSVLSLLLYSCKKDNSNNEPYAHSPIVGKWYLMTDSILNYTNNKLTRVVSATSYTPQNATMYYQFNSDGSAIIAKGYDSPLNGVFILNGTSISIITPPFNTNTPSGIITVAGTTDTGKFKLLTADKLVMHFNSYEFLNGDTIRVTEAAYLSK